MLTIHASPSSEDYEHVLFTSGSYLRLAHVASLGSAVNISYEDLYV